MCLETLVCSVLKMKAFSHVLASFIYLCMSVLIDSLINESVSATFSSSLFNSQEMGNVLRAMNISFHLNSMLVLTLASDCRS